MVCFGCYICSKAEKEANICSFVGWHLVILPVEGLRVTAAFKVTSRGHSREYSIVIHKTGFILTTCNSEDDASLSSFQALIIFFNINLPSPSFLFAKCIKKCNNGCMRHWCNCPILILICLCNVMNSHGISIQHFLGIFIVFDMYA